MSTSTNMVPRRTWLPAVVARQLPAIVSRQSPVVRPQAASPAAGFTDFLPAHLEILETPASPKMGFLLWTLCGMFSAALAWSCVAKIDIYAEAKGRLQPSGRSKVVQPVQVGRVVGISVANGSRVRAGDLLIKLDSTQADADRDAAKAELASLKSEIARRTTEIVAARLNIANPTITFPADVPELFRKRDDALFQAEIGQYRDQVDTINAQIAEKTARKTRLVDTIAARERLIAPMRERLTMKSTLEAKQAGTHAAVLDATQALQTEERNLADDRGQSIENDAAAVSLQSRLKQALSTFLADQNQHLSDAMRRQDDVEQNLIKAEDRVQQTRIVAPIDGTVQQLGVTTVGQVVSVGQPLMVIVPSTGALEVMALVQNQDIGFVQPDQPVVLKIDAFPFTHYGTLDGKVTRISNEAVDSQEATASSDASTLAQNVNNSALSASQRVQNLVYPAVVQLDRTEINADGKAVPLIPGMMVTAEIRTGSRRVIQYLLAPIWEATSGAAHER